MSGKVSRRGFLSSLTKASVGLVGVKSFGGNQKDETDWKTKWEEDYQNWHDSIDEHLRIEENLGMAIKRLFSIIDERNKEISGYECISKRQVAYIKLLDTIIHEHADTITEQHQEIVVLEGQLYAPASFYLPRDTSRDVDVVQEGADEDVISRFVPFNDPIAGTYYAYDVCRTCGGTTWEYDDDGQAMCSGCGRYPISTPLPGLDMIIRTGHLDEMTNRRIQEQLDNAPWVSAFLKDVEYVPEASDDQT